MSPSRLSMLSRLLLLVSSSLILAVSLGHWVLPGRSGLTSMNWAAHWIKSAEPSDRSHYRTTIDVPFTPLWAWVAVAAEDYILYINGKIVASDNISVDTTRPLQSQISDQAQSMTPFGPAIAYGPELRRAGNAEWLFPEHVQIASYLHPGRNVLALFVQSPSPSGAQFAIRGEIMADGQSVAIPAQAKDWKTSNVASRISGVPWYSPQIETLDWPPARTGEFIDQPFYATAPPAIWETMMPRVGLTGPTSGGDLRLGLGMAGVAPGQQNGGWVRVYSNWLYYLFVDDQLVGTGGGNRVADAWDLTSFLSSTAQRLNLQLVRQTSPLLTPLQTDPVPLVVVDGQVGSHRFSSESGWRQVEGTGSGWLSGTANWKAAELAPQDTLPSSVVFQFPAELGVSWSAQFAVLWLLCAAALLAIYHALRLGERFLGRTRDEAGAAALWMLSLLLVGLIVAGALQLRMSGTDSILLFIRPENLWFVQILGPLLLAGAMAVYHTTPSVSATPAAWREPLRRHLPTIALVAIIALALGLRLYKMGFEDLQADEKVSWDAAAGVMRTGGLPLEYSGIFYTRSALYHEALAGWLTLFGNTKAAARAFSVIPGVLSIWFTYRLTLLASGGRRIPALLAALVMAIDPWELRNAQNIRFYQQVQAFSIVAMEAFLLGFVDRRGKLYQNLFFVLASMACFSQEVFVLTFPGFCIAGLYFYRPWRWRENLNVCIGFVAVMGLAIYDIVIFEIMTLTANNGISSSDLPAMLLHVLSVATLAVSFFAGQAHGHLIFSLPFFVGLVYWVRRSNRYIGTLYIQIICGLITGTVLVMQIQNRYVYLFYPFLIVVAAVTADAILRDIAYAISAFAGSGAEPLRRRWLSAAGGLVGIGLLVGVEPGRTWRSFNWATITQEESGFRFVVDHRLPGDAVLATSPDSVATVVGDLDYTLTYDLQFDTLYQPGDEIVDRWSGGKVLSNLDMLRKVLITHDRVWLVLTDAKFRNYPQAWQDLLDWLSPSTSGLAAGFCCGIARRAVCL